MTRPNIIYILVDDMGYGDFGCMNPDPAVETTPRLDALMREGITLNQHYTASPVCNPSRACLLTGRYPHRTGSIDTLEPRGLERMALRETTLGDALKHAGYRTGLIGKWHLGSFDDRYHPLRRGFDETICFRGGMHDYYDWRLDWQDSVRRADGRYLTDVWTEEACAFIERHHGGPFFLHVTYNAPHTPIQAPENIVRPFAECGRFNNDVATLYGMIRRMDEGVERILDTLDRHGLRDNTIVVFSSDNGPQMMPTSEGTLERYNCNLRGEKCQTWDGGIRVPGIIRWPDGLPSDGREEDAFFHFADWYPTLLGLAGVERPRGLLPIDGLDQSALLREERKIADYPARFWQWNRYTPRVEYNAAMREGEWKLVRPCVPEATQITDEDIEWIRESMYRPGERFMKGEIICEPFPEMDYPVPPAPQLFNLREDPCEQHDLSERMPERLKRMMSDLQEWFDDVERERRSIDEPTRMA